MFGSKVERHEIGAVKDTTGYYLSLLGTDRMPESAAKLPGELKLPAEVFGDIEAAIFSADEDGIDRAQAVYFDPEYGFGYTRIYASNNIRTLSAETLGRLARGHFGVRPLLSYCVRADGYWGFRARDLAVDMAVPRRALMICTGSMSGIEVLLQTGETYEKPLYGVVGEGKDWRLMGKNDFDSLSHDEMARIAEDLGFGYYTWSPEGKSLVPGEISDDLLFSRVSLMD